MKPNIRLSGLSALALLLMAGYVPPGYAQSRNEVSCASLFKDNTSVLRGAFKVVDPEPYYSMCLNDKDNNGDICKVATAYVHEAARHEANVRMPSQCVASDSPPAN